MDKFMNIAAIIVAAGRGIRAGGDIPKQWQKIAGRIVAAHTIERFSCHPLINRVILVINPNDRPFVAQHLDTDQLTVVNGGATRNESVLAGLNALKDRPPERVLIHDGARPMVQERVISDVIQALDHAPGAAPALAVSDALWRGQDGFVTGTQDRDGLYRAQTPQGFWFSDILAAHHQHPGGAADDVEVARHMNLRVKIVNGCEDNLKITTPEDFSRAEKLIIEQRGT